MNHAMPRATRAPFALALLAGSALAAPAFGQSTQTAPSATASGQAQPVIVESTRIPTELDKTGASVTVITEEDIEEAGDRTVTDALRRVPGVDISQNGGLGSQASVRLRGANSEQTLVLIDGIEVNDPSTPSGGFDFGGLTASNIEKIEILRGPQSTLYGSDAIGGVVSITTKSGERGLSGNAALEGGSFGTVRGNGTLRVGGERAQGAITLSGTRTDGISAADENNGNDEKDGFRDITVTGRGQLELSKHLRLEAAVNVNDQRQEFDNTPEPGNLQTDADRVSFTNRIAGRISARHTAFADRVQNKLSVKLVDIDRENKGTSNFNAEGERRTIAYQGTFDVADWLVLSIGGEVEDNAFRTQPGSDGGFTNSSGYGMAKITPIERLTLTAGVRHDANDRFADATTMRATAAYNLRETGTTLRAVWGEGFKTPTLSQISFTNPGITLEPERSESWEFGIDQTLFQDRLSASVTYFNQDIDDLIEFDRANFTFRNRAKTSQQGVEVSLNVVPTDWMEFSANYTYLDAENAQTNERLIRRARHKAGLDLRTTPTDRSRFFASVTYNGKEKDEPSGQRVTLDDYVLVTLRGAYDVRKNVEIFGRLENALNQEYQTAFGFGTPDISGFAGVRVSF